MSAVTRRRALLGLLPAAGASIALPTIAAAEEPHDRVRRLMDELGEALNHVHDGHFGARVHPSNCDGASALYNVRLWTRDMDAARDALDARRMLASASAADRAVYHADLFSDAMDEIDGKWCAMILSEGQGVGRGQLLFPNLRKSVNLT